MPDSDALRIDILLPALFEGSGGLRTVVALADDLAEAGFNVHIHVEVDESKTRKHQPPRDVQRELSELYGLHRAAAHLGWPKRLPDSAVIVATAWFSVVAVSTIVSPARRFYFVQDYEPMFLPRGDLQLAAEASYEAGLETIVIGSWLRDHLRERHGVAADSVPFTADLTLYTDTGNAATPTRHRVVALYQPEKPRRCAGLLSLALRDCMAATPELEVVTFGSADGPHLGGNHRHVGLLPRRKLPALYRSATVGVALSATNTSRVPFEMMACGLPVVDLDLSSNAANLPRAGSVLAKPNPSSLAGSILEVLGNPERRDALSRGGRDFMSQRPHPLEGATFVDIVRQRLLAPAPAPRAADEGTLPWHPTYARMASEQATFSRKFARRVAKALNARLDP